MPAGGRLSAGIVGGFRSRCCALAPCQGASAAAHTKAKVIVSCFISPPIGAGLGTHRQSSRANATRSQMTMACKTLPRIYLTFRPVPPSRESVRDAGIGCISAETVLALSAVQKLEHLPRLRMPPSLRLFEDRSSIPNHFESSASRRDQFHLLARKCLTNLSRQTDGAWFVVSNCAVFDRNHQ